MTRVPYPFSLRMAKVHLRRGREGFIAQRIDANLPYASTIFVLPISSADFHWQVGELLRFAIVVDEERILVACSVKAWVPEESHVDHHGDAGRQVVVACLGRGFFLQALGEADPVPHAVRVVTAEAPTLLRYLRAAKSTLRAGRPTVSCSVASS